MHAIQTCHIVSTQSGMGQEVIRGLLAAHRVNSEISNKWSGTCLQKKSSAADSRISGIDRGLYSTYSRINFNTKLLLLFIELYHRKLR